MTGLSVGRKVRAHITDVIVSFLFLDDFSLATTSLILSFISFPFLHLSFRTSIIMLPTRYWNLNGQEHKSANPRASSSSRLHDQLDAILAAPRIPKITIKKPIFQLRDFQSDAIDAITYALEVEKLSCIGVSAPAGSGKTTIFTMLIPFIPSLNEGQKVLIIVPYVHLIRQTEDVIRARLPRQYHIGVEQGSRSPHVDDDM